MILNNYRAILEVRDIKKEKLTPALLCHLQKILTDQETLDTPGASAGFVHPKKQSRLWMFALKRCCMNRRQQTKLNGGFGQICDFANSVS